MSQIVIVHCSDVHFGKVLANDEFSGPKEQYGHDFLLCEGLTGAMNDVRIVTGLPDEEEMRIVVSGDLTATGHQDEFIVGHSYFRSHFRLRRDPANDITGFDVRAIPQPDDLPLRAIPGNHDHWTGSRWMWGNNPYLRNTHFRSTPWLLPWQSGPLLVEVAGLDSCSGVSPKERNKRQLGILDLSAGGELDQLKALLRASDQAGLPAGVTHRVRAVVVHHSLAYPGKYLGIFLKMDVASKRALLELAEEFHIAAFLTGHTHDFFFKPSFKTLPKGLHEVYELRCASTLQGPDDRDPEPGFWAHKIWLDGGAAKWSGWRYYWTGNAFEPVDRNKPCVEFPTP